MTATRAGTDFGDALRRQIEGRPQREFGDEVARAEGRVDDRGKHAPYSQQQVSFWLSGQQEPNPSQAFAIERVLRLRPGTLTRLLGFLPLDARSVVSVEEAVRTDPALDRTGREAVLGVYRTMSRRPGPPGRGSKP